MHTSLWSFLSVSSQPIFTPPYATLALTSNTYTLLTSSPTPGSITYHYQVPHNSAHTQPLFIPLWYSNDVRTFETNLYPRQYHLQIHSATSPH